MALTNAYDIIIAGLQKSPTRLFVMKYVSRVYMREFTTLNYAVVLRSNRYVTTPS